MAKMNAVRTAWPVRLEVAMTLRIHKLPLNPIAVVALLLPTP
jgi:hypothetical protein